MELGVAETLVGDALDVWRFDRAAVGSHGRITDIVEDDVNDVRRSLRRSGRLEG